MKQIFLLAMLVSVNALSKTAQEDVSGQVKKRVFIADSTVDCKTHSLAISDVSQVLAFALQCNQTVRSKLDEAEVSYTQLRRLGFIEGPKFEFAALFPITEGSLTAFDIKAKQNLMELVGLANQKKFGRASYQKKKFEIAAEVLDALKETKTAYFRHQADLASLHLWQSNLIAAKSAAELASGQRNAGNISALDEAQQAAFSKMAELEMAKNQSLVFQSQMALAKQMGLKSGATLQIQAQLPALPAQDPNLEHLVLMSSQHRPAMLAQKYELQVRRQEIELGKLNFIPQLNVGVSAQFDPDGNRNIGPLIEFGIPFIGYGAGVGQARAQLGVERHALRAIEQSSLYDIESQHQKLLLARKTVNLYETEILPLSEKIVQEALKHYNYMLVGNYQLLQFKQNEIQARQKHIEAQRDYWIAYAELENLVGHSIEEQHGHHQNHVHHEH